MAKKKKFTDDSEDVSKEAQRRLLKEKDRRESNRNKLDNANQNRMVKGFDSSRSLLDATLDEAAARSKTRGLLEQVSLDERTASHEGPATKRAMSNASYQRDLNKMGFAMEPEPRKKKKGK
jgi:hypothetical protein